MSHPFVAAGTVPLCLYDLDDLETLGVYFHDSQRLPGLISISCSGSEKDPVMERITVTPHDAVLRFMQHEIGKKTGSVFSPFEFRDNKRASLNAVRANLAIFDCDHGQLAHEILGACAAVNAGAVLVSSHSHLKTETTYRSEDWQAWLDEHQGGTAEQFLLSKGVHPDVAQGAHHHLVAGDDHRHIMIKHNPWPKWRLILFPTRPWEFEDYGDFQAAQAGYRGGMLQLAERLGLVIDQNALDLARVFFDPRHPRGAIPEAVFLEGGAIDVWPVRKEVSNEASGDLITIDESDLPLPDLSTLRSALEAIRNDDRFSDRNEWVRVAASVHAGTGGSEEGFELFDTWCKTWTFGSNDPFENRRVWDSLKIGETKNDVGLGTLFYLAERDGWMRLQDTGAVGPAPHGDIWNGIRFAENFRGQYLYVDAVAGWVRWTGTHWAGTTTSEMEARCKDVAQMALETRAKSLRNSPEQDRSLLSRALEVTRSIASVRRIAEAARSEPGMSIPDPSSFDRDPMQIGVRNGTFDLRSREIYPARPEHMISKQIGTAFDPNATAPRFLAFLEAVQPDPEIRQFLQRAVGYSLTGLVNEEVFFFLYGTGANGKSVFGNILSALLQDYAVALGSTIVAKNKHENEAERQKARLPGIRVAQVNEVAQGDIWDDQRLKELASREPMSARLLHKEAFQFFPTHKLWIRGNHLPGVHDTGDGFWRRLVPILFDVQIAEKERVPDLDLQIIESELPGVLNWALEGLWEWQAQGLAVPAQLRLIGSQYRSDTDLFGQWMETCFVLEANARTTSAEAYTSYQAFCEEEGISPISKVALGRSLASRGFKKAPATSVRAFLGFHIRNADDTDAPIDAEDEDLL